jgi:NOL1/NOP2/fmu family ribosome biogenesis protein
VSRFAITLATFSKDGIRWESGYAHDYPRRQSLDLEPEAADLWCMAVHRESWRKNVASCALVARRTAESSMFGDMISTGDPI